VTGGLLRNFTWAILRGYLARVSRLLRLFVLDIAPVCVCVHVCVCVCVCVCMCTSCGARVSIFEAVCAEYSACVCVCVCVCV